MPGRAVVMSPGGTAPISTPSAANFMWSGLVTVAPFLGSTNQTRTRFFAAAGFAAGLAACAAAITLNPAAIASTSSGRCFLIYIRSLLRRSLASRLALHGSAKASSERHDAILARPEPAAGNRFFQHAGGGLQ